MRNHPKGGNGSTSSNPNTHTQLERGEGRPDVHGMRDDCGSCFPVMKGNTHRMRHRLPPAPSIPQLRQSLSPLPPPLPAPSSSSSSKPHSRGLAEGPPLPRGGGEGSSPADSSDPASSLCPVSRTLPPPSPIRWTPKNPIFLRPERQIESLKVWPHPQMPFVMSGLSSPGKVRRWSIVWETGFRVHGCPASHRRFGGLVFFFISHVPAPRTQSPAPRATSYHFYEILGIFTFVP